MKIEIPMKLPSLNDYICACKVTRGKWNKGNQMKKDCQNAMMQYLKPLPHYRRPVKIHFTWIEENGKRDLDNVCFAKKFILDAMVIMGILQNDNRKWVVGFTDSFAYDDQARIIIDIEEVTKDDIR